jgi:hypothetical protein
MIGHNDMRIGSFKIIFVIKVYPGSQNIQTPHQKEIQPVYCNFMGFVPQKSMGYELKDMKDNQHQSKDQIVKN